MVSKPDPEIVTGLNFLFDQYRRNLAFKNLWKNSSLVPGDGLIDKLGPDLIIVGEAPGKTEADRGIPFVGRSGKFLSELLNSINTERKRCYVTNLVKFWPGEGNPDPTPLEAKTSVSFLRREIKLVAGECRMIVGLGRFANQAIFGDELALGGQHGKILDLGTGFQLFVSYHPSWGIRGKTNKQVMIRDWDKLREFMEFDV